MNKAGFYLSVSFAVLSLLLATGLQALPFVVVAVLSGFNVFAKKNFYPFILVISILMFLINLEAVSLIDIVAWFAIAVLTYEK